MRNIKFKISILLIILISTIITNISVASDRIFSTNLYSTGKINNLIKYQEVEIETDFLVYKNDGIEYPAYNLGQNLQEISGSDYSINVERLISNAMVWRAITNGYPYKTYTELDCDNKEQAYMATSQAVYCILYDRDLNSYTAMNEEGEKCLNVLETIVNYAKESSDTKISSDITVKGVNSKWEIDKVNSKYISMTYETTAVGPIDKYTVSLSGTLPEGIYVADEQSNKKTIFNRGEKFKILIPITNLIRNGDFTVDVEGIIETNPILYGISEGTNQDYALTMSNYEDGSGSQKTYYTKNSTKITILKQDKSTKKALEGVQFEVLDENQKILYTGLITDENGQISLDNLLPGKYFVKEIKTLKGYSLYDKLIGADVDLNEELKIILNTSEETVTVEYATSKDELESQEKDKETESKKEDSSIETKNKVETISTKLPKTGF